MERAGISIAYHFGTMIEVPRAALIAGSLAKVSEFFSFGTNDLTQMTFGYSRDDAEGSIVKPYMEGVVGKGGAIRQILSVNPFAVLDRDGVGALIRMAVDSGQQTRPNIELGICGEHGGDPASIAFATEVGLSYVSASPYRVPVARLAAAHAQIAIQSTWAEDAFNRR